MLVCTCPHVKESPPLAFIQGDSPIYSIPVAPFPNVIICGFFFFFFELIFYTLLLIFSHDPILLTRTSVHISFIILLVMLDRSVCLPKIINHLRTTSSSQFRFIFMATERRKKRLLQLLISDYYFLFKVLLLI